MKKILVSILIAGTAVAHVPVVTPANRPVGDKPPHIEPKPLPPVVFENPVTHTPMVFLLW